MITSPLFADLGWLVHGFGLRDSPPRPEVRLLKQIHSNLVFDVATCSDGVVEGDALVANGAGRIVGVRTADCVPVLLADPVTRTVAAIHAGWRGTAANIVGEAVRMMAAKWDVQPSSLLAAIGPSIGPCCYEVGPEVAARFGTDEPNPVQLDLPFQNELRLREAGLERIWRSGECTFCRPDRFFSYRREKEEAGRMISFIGRTE